MVRKLLLVGLVAGLFLYLRSERRRNYPLDVVSTPSGRTFTARQLPDQCERETCVHRVAYLTEIRDTTALRDEAQALLAWLDTKLKGSPTPHFAGILAVEPGFMRLSAPRRIVALSFVAVIPGTWAYAQQEDVSAQMAGFLKGQ